MTKFLSEKFDGLIPYVPGEQPQGTEYIKLNTNENPYPPSPKVKAAVESAEQKLRLYPDPASSRLTVAIADYYKIDKENVFVGNGSDEVLAMIFFAFFDKNKAVAFPDISYGFYPVYADLFGITREEIPLKEDFSIDVAQYVNTDKNIVLANPNAPTGMALPLADIELIASSNADRLVVIDEAYVDFGAESAVKLIKKYDNLIVTQTLSKSRSLAGGRLGIAFACQELIKDIEKIKFSFNSYNVNRLTEEAALASIKDREYFERTRRQIMEDRDKAIDALRKLGCEVLDSQANFFFMKYPSIEGKELYSELKKRGILVRHFDKARIEDYIRITVGTAAQMKILTENMEQIIEENKK